MKVGMHLGYQNLYGVPDVQSFMQETKLAVEAEAMGFDYVGPVEHHFTDYGACPDPFQVLAYVAARTKNIRLAPAVTVLPLHHPIRVARKWYWIREAKKMFLSARRFWMRMVWLD